MNDGKQLLILAYMGTYEKPQKLEGVVGAVPKQMYQNQILQLIQELEKVGQAKIRTLSPIYKFKLYCSIINMLIFIINGGFHDEKARKNKVKLRFSMFI